MRIRTYTNRIARGEQVDHDFVLRNGSRQSRSKRPNFSGLLPISEFIIEDYRHSGAFGDVNNALKAVSKVNVNHMRMAGESPPDYRELILRGDNATSSFEGYHPRTKRFGHFDWVLRGRGSVPGPYEFAWHFRGRYAGSLASVPATVSVDLDNRAKAKFIKKARAAQSSGMLGETLHDLGRTITSYGRLSRFFADSLRKPSSIAERLGNELLGQGRRHPSWSRKFRDYQKAISNNWLEYYLGVKPHIADLENMGDALMRTLNYSLFGYDTARVHGRGREVSKTFSTGSMAPLSGFTLTQPRVDFHAENTLTSYVAYYGNVRTHHERTLGYNIGQELGLGLNSFVPTLYEWIPYTWLLDYFSNLGAIVSAVSFPSSDVVWVNRLIRNTVDIKISYSSRMAIPPNPDVKILENTFSPESWTLQNKYIKRVPYLGSLVPAFRLRLPGDMSQFATVVALIGSLASRNRDFTQRLYHL